MNSLIALVNALTAPISLSALKSVLLAMAAGIRPYEVYTILISQSSTSDPTAIVLENTTGEKPTFSRIDVGVYGINATGLFTSDKTFCMINSGDDNFSIFRNSADQVRITTADAAGAATDGLLTKVEVEIRIYS